MCYHSAMDDTISYYEEHASEFARDTLHLDLSRFHSAFLSLIPDGGRILDLGCGTGRDSRVFSEMGFSVTAMDGSEAMCMIAGKTAGIPVINSDFESFVSDVLFDGIWASASLLHVYREHLPHIFRRYGAMLRKGGVFYSSFRYGSFSGDIGGRYYTYLDEESFSGIIAQSGLFSIKEIAVTPDLRPGREKELWLNAFMIADQPSSSMQ